MSSTIIMKIFNKVSEWYFSFLFSQWIANVLIYVKDEDKHEEETVRRQTKKKQNRNGKKRGRC